MRENRYKTSLFGLVGRRLFQILFPWRAAIHSNMQIRRTRRRSIYIRQVDGGSSNAAEVEIAALFNPVYDVERFGIHLVVSPRHADVMLITGPLTRNMINAVLAAFEAMPYPRKVITVGNCFEENIENPFSGSYATVALPEEIAAARIAHIPGDPPSPQAILEVLLKL